MRLKPIDSFLAAHVVLLLRTAGAASVIGGLIGGFVWLVAWQDRSDGDSLRYGHFHNAFMQFPPFNHTFLDATVYILLACSAAMGLGGLMLLAPSKWGVPLVTWQTRVSIITNAIIVVFIVAMMFIFANNQSGVYHLGGTSRALVLRLSSIAVDLTLWAFFSSKAVREFPVGKQIRPAAHSA